LGAGESAASISMQFGLSLSALKVANPDLDLRRLKSGDSIQIPGPGLTPAPVVPPQ
jgi:hypothetical protein